jgi:hypothetical protein
MRMWPGHSWEEQRLCCCSEGHPARTAQVFCSNSLTHRLLYPAIPAWQHSFLGSHRAHNASEPGELWGKEQTGAVLTGTFLEYHAQGTQKKTGYPFTMFWMRERTLSFVTGCCYTYALRRILSKGFVEDVTKSICCLLCVCLGFAVIRLGSYCQPQLSSTSHAFAFSPASLSM